MTAYRECENAGLFAEYGREAVKLLGSVYNDTDSYHPTSYTQGRFYILGYVLRCVQHDRETGVNQDESISVLICAASCLWKSGENSDIDMLRALTNIPPRFLGVIGKAWEGLEFTRWKVEYGFYDGL